MLGITIEEFRTQEVMDRWVQKRLLFFEFKYFLKLAMHINFIKIILLSLVLIISGCGGGGGGNTSNLTSGTDTNTNPSPSSNTVVTANGHKLSLVQVAWAKNDIIASTKLPTTVAGVSVLKQQIQNLLNRFIPTAYAITYQPTYPPVTYDPSFQASRKLINGNLVKLDPVVKIYQRDSNGKIVLDSNGLPIEVLVTCDLSNVEISITQVYELFASGPDFLANVNVPDTVLSDCRVTTRQSWIYVTGAGLTFDVTSAFANGVKDIIPAGDPAFNQSDTPLIIDTSGIVKYAQIQADKTLKIVQLTSPDAPIETSYTGAIAYDGRYLLGASRFDAAQSATYFVYQRDSNSFRIFRPGSSSFGWETNFYLSTGLDDQGRFLFHYASSEFQALNTSNLSYANAFSPPSNISAPPTTSNFPGNMYGLQGRYGKWLMSDRGVIWNYETKQSLCLMTYPNTSTSLTNYSNCAWGGKYVRLWNKYAYAVDRDMRLFVRYDLDTGLGTSFNLDTAGYLAKSFKVFRNLAMVEVVNVSTSDRKYVELNFDDNKLIERGIITSGGRTADTFTSIGGGG